MPSRQQKPRKMIFSFSEYADVMANFSLIREAAVDIYKETGCCLCLKWIQIVTVFIKINKSRAPLEIFVLGLNLEVAKIQVINASNTIQVATKKILEKLIIL